MDPLVIPIVALAIPVIVVPTAIVSKMFQRMREMEHAERLRALELGLTLPKDEPFWSPSRITAGIGLFVPIASLIVAWASAESLGPDRSEMIQNVAGAIGIASVASGGLLANRLMKLRYEGRGRVASGTFEAKPVYDPDTFDVVGRRG